MVVWGYPCESKSSPAFKSKTPSAKAEGVFYCVRKIKVEKYTKLDSQTDEFPNTFVKK